MRWSFKWRKELETGQYYDLVSRGFISKEADLEPEITGLEFYLDAYRELDTSRPVGMDIMPIPFTAILEYFRIYELGDFDEFLYLIRLLDREFMKMNAEVNKAKGSSNGGGNTGTKDTSRR